MLLIDEHRLLAESLGAVLAAEPDLRIVGTAGLPGEAVALAGRAHPDVALLSYAFATAEDGRAPVELRAQCPALKLLVLIAAPDDETIAACVRIGAVGYVGKDSTPTTLAAAIRRADAGQVLFAPDVLIRLLAPGRHPVAETAPPLATVRPSDRELAVLRLVATGLSTAEVAAPLYISGHTVRAHLKSALRKLGARSKLEAVLIAVRAGWITLPE